MSEDSGSFTFGDLEVGWKAEREKGELFVKAFCPLCEHTDDSSDHGYGMDHALKITKGKIKTHLRLIHKLDVK
jgi:hypothetical protein